MKLHEYQAKSLFSTYGIPTTSGYLVSSPAEMNQLMLKGPLYVKAQVLVGGRGKAGGIRLARDVEEARLHLLGLLGHDLRGEIVRMVLIEKALTLESELYLAFIVDRSSRGLVAIASSSGGIDIEEVARTAPERIAREPIDPFLGFPGFRARGLGRRLGLSGTLLKDFAAIATALHRLCQSEDTELAEINPLAVVDGRLLAVDAKVIIDDNAVFRHPSLPKNEELTALEQEAKSAGLSYVELAGDIAIIGNGAGLVMSTLDMVAHFGGAPANFLDVGGGASEENMRQAIAIVTRKPGIRALLVNIFGGITRCDDIARAIAASPPPVPMVVRLTGTNEDDGRKILKSAGIDAFVDPEEATRRVIGLARERA